MAQPAAYDTLREGVRVTFELEDRRSRFVATLARAGSERAARELVEEVRAANRDARHNVFAYSLADGRERATDDGEPHGTAGMPVLEELRAAGLADACCVVTRYFGGVLLGTGGLQRAYSGAAKGACALARERGDVCRMTLVRRVAVQLPYALYDRVRRMCEDAGGRVADSLFQEDVQLTCVFAAGEEERFVAAVTELAAGEQLCSVGEPVFAEL